ncbi:hypothetical protein DPMN_005118 [Dreissena polymorpha]|uniref:Uncharacterized protein n=1 Tax=Dreissena polymorpha TaxID=45954 RepID=A0A9D4MPR3_DREPO|nr:hypothetical protein DPMN_005118 [Dreissena polymorpha]
MKSNGVRHATLRREQMTEADEEMSGLYDHHRRIASRRTSYWSILLEQFHTDVC